MSAKELVLEYVRSLPDAASWEEIVTALPEHPPAPPAFAWPTPDVTEADWSLLVARSLEAELADPREDIYTLDDGTPPDEPR